jgi:hypothetical protein
MAYLRGLPVCPQRAEFGLTVEEVGNERTHTPPQIIGKFKKWAEARAGELATGTLKKTDMPTFCASSLIAKRKAWIIWDEFFKTFDEAQLTFLYQDKTRTGQSATLTNSSRVT